MYVQSALIRKHIDYVYATWQYKVLSMKKLFEGKIIWEENDRLN